MSQTSLVTFFVFSFCCGRLHSNPKFYLVSTRESPSLPNVQSAHLKKTGKGFTEVFTSKASSKGKLTFNYDSYEDDDGDDDGDNNDDGGNVDSKSLLFSLKSLQMLMKIC